ncbi:restriction endonuclease subunit S [Shouchella clausii]|uniref:restriction endonuclease subunit S n=1 Tax=Shouchella clausii TaxID=79880 RepID=UPI000BA63FAA|nr:restriction endonuclease subunit S [Shouchella clausii]PAD46144.1 hypothetical protein CHI09_13530 [Shouchella clausii]PAF07918.1 hypothetical protein CHH65_18750 [Shouchella clausii]
MTLIKNLSEVCEIIMGQSPASETYNDKQIGVPFYQGKADFGDVYPTARVYCSKPIKIAKEKDILMSVRAPVGDVNIATSTCCIGRGLAAIRPDSRKIYSKFLYYVLLSKKSEIGNMGTGSTFKAISKSQIIDIKIPVPDLKEQINIVNLLDTAKELITKRKAQIEALDQLTQSVFLEMFGDPVQNEKKWPVRNFDYFAKIDTVMVNDFTSLQELPHIGIDSIEKDTGRISNYRTVKEDNVKSAKYRFTDSHIVYSKIRPYLNKVATPDFGGVCSADAYPILINKEHASKHYFAFLMRSEAFLNHVNQQSGRTNIPKVNKKQLLLFKGMCPPVELQNQFDFLHSKIEERRKIMFSGLYEINNLYESIIQRAFKGELFTEEKLPTA